MFASRVFTLAEKYQVQIWLGLITLVALVLRLHAITQSPPSPYWEEVAIGYDASSILATGRDHHGNPFPWVAFPSFGDYKPSLYFYTVVPSIAAFGLNTFAVRFPAALASSLTVGLTSWLAWRWTRSRAMLGWSGLLLAIQPWSWQIGRVGFEVNLAVFLIVLALVLFESAHRNNTWKKPLVFSVAAALLALSAFAYHAGRVWGPAVGALVYVTLTPWHQLPRNPRAWLRQHARVWLPAALSALLVLLPLLLELGSPVVQQRVQQTSVFSRLEPLVRAAELKEPHDNALWSRVVYHRWWGRLGDLATSYASHFSPSFVFGNGDSNPRHTTHFFGMLAPWEVLTVGAGLVALFVTWPLPPRRKALLAGLMLVSPLAAMFTIATPHGLRALLLSPWLAIVSAAGVVTLLRWARNQGLRWLPRPAWAAYRNFILAGASGLIVASTTVFWLYIGSVYPVLSEEHWQYGAAEAIQSVRQHQRPGEALFLTRTHGRPAMYVFFFESIDPRRVQAASAVAQKDQLEFLEFEEWSFGDFAAENSPGVYALAPEDHVPANATLLDTITGQAGEVYWRVYRVE